MPNDFSEFGENLAQIANTFRDDSRSEVMDLDDSQLGLSPALRNAVVTALVLFAALC
jgi:hypothetical protein